jgi:hypothetical protein
VVSLLVQPLEKVQHLLDQVLPDVPDEPILLENFTAHVEVQVGGIHHAADEPEIFGHQLLAVVHDEDALAIQVDAVLPIRKEEVERSLGRNVQQGAVFGDALQLQVQMGQRIVPVVADVLVELLVFVVGDFALVPGPDGLHGIEGLVFPDLPRRLADRLAVLVLDPLLFGDRLVLLHLHPDGIGHEIGMLLDDVPDHPFLEIILVQLRLGLEAQDHAGTPFRLFRRFHGVGAAALGLPAYGLVGLGPPGDDGDFFRHDEGGIESPRRTGR